MNKSIIVKKHYSYDFADWSHCKTFKNLLRENIKFIKGIYKTSPYHASPIYDMNNKNLLYLHQNGILTINGQGNFCEYFRYNPLTKHEYYHNDKIEKENINKPYYYTHEQKPGLNGYFERDKLQNIIIFMEFLIKEYKMPIKYTFYDIDNDKYYTNFKKAYYKLSRYAYTDKIHKDKSKLNWNRNYMYYKEHENNSHILEDKFNIKTHIKNIIYFEIFINKYCYYRNIEDLLVDFIKYFKLHKNNNNINNNNISIKSKIKLNKSRNLNNL